MSTPTVEELAFSYEIGVDIALSGDGEETLWQQIRGISAVAPTAPPLTFDAATYDDKGAPNAQKVSESPTLAFTVQGRRLESGLYRPEVERLLELADPEAVGEAAIGRFRYYDNPQSGPANPTDAYEIDGSVEVTRQNTDNASVAVWSVTVTGQGRRRRIANPMTEEAPAG